MLNNSTKNLESRQESREELTRDSDEELPLFDHLRSNVYLPALPPIASQILKMCRSEEADVDQLAALMSQDPAVVARLLQTANSSYFGGSRHKVTNIVQAVTLLGMDAVGSLAFSFCFYRLFQDMNNPGQAGMNHGKFWRRSIMASIAGRTLGQWCKAPDPELIHISALLQDIGLLALNSVAPEVTGTLTTDSQDDHTQLQILEKQYFGCDHAKMGKWIAESWQLPEEFQAAIAASHHPEIPNDCSTARLTTLHCVALSGRLADVWCQPDTEKAVWEATTAAKDFLDLTPKDVEAILRLIPRGLTEIASFFQDHIGSAQEIDHILNSATKILLAMAPDTVQDETSFRSSSTVR